MPYKSDAQRRFFHAAEDRGDISSKVVNEFDKASKGKELPERVKKHENMAEGGIPAQEGDEFTNGLKEGINHDSDAVKSYLKSKLQGLMHPMSEADQAAKQIGEMTTVEQGEAAKKQAEAIGMAEGGTWMQNVPEKKVAEVTHIEGKQPTEDITSMTGTEHGYGMAEGGTIHKAEDREKEPARPADIDMGHEEKLKSIYKAMGIQKYADGGISPIPAPTGPALGMPNPTDPTYWDQVKAALAKVSAPVTQPIGAINNVVTNAAQAVTPIIPDVVSATNKLTGMSLPVPAAPAPKTPDLGTPTPLSAQMPPIPPPAPAAAPAGVPAAGAPDLKNLFNQDTSKLTEGMNAEDRQALAGKVEGQQRGVGSVVAEALAGLGDALAAKGGREQHALKDIFSMQKQQRDEALANFDKARQDRLEKLDIQTKMGNNTIQQLAAQDAYGTDEHLNKMLGAPPGTLHKDLPLYMQMKTAELAQNEKDTDLYMKAHKQAADEVESSIKNASMFNMKPSPEQIKAAGAKLADQYYNRAKGNILFAPSDGQKPLWIPAKNAQAAKKMDPQGQIIP